MIKEIETRRSIRKYIDKEVSKEVLDDLLHAAMHSPTAKNTQEWRFFVSNNRAFLNEVATFPNYKMLEGAGACILVCGDRDAIKKDVVKEEYLYVDCAAATQTILLEAKSLGVGTCWCAVAPNEDRINAITKFFKLKENLLPVAIISIGYPGEEKGIEDRFDEKKITWL